MRAMWKGEISFGLVMIPVRLYSATEHRDVSFRQVHAADAGRIRFRRVCSVCEEEVPFSEVAKGYELPDGGMVVLTDDDLADLPLPTTRSIEVVQFTPAGQIDPLMWERGYYAEPEPKGVRAYALLRDALAKSGLVGVVRVALRQREALATLRAHGDLLVLGTLLWPDEIREPDFEFLGSATEVRPQELTMATSLVESMTADFDASSYADHYREALAELVAAKVEGHEVAPPVVRPDEQPAPSLADALRASLAAVREPGEDSSPAKSGKVAAAAGEPAAEKPAGRRSRRSA